MAADGLAVIMDNGTPKIAVVGFEPTPEVVPVSYLISIDGLLTDTTLASHVQDRFDQAGMSSDVGASLAALIMLGSGLEGLLMGFTIEHYDAPTMKSSLPKGRGGQSKSLHELTLQDLILFSHAVSWIESDAKDFANILRDYRNLVHPMKQITGNYSTPNRGTLDMCFPVIQQVVSDLKETLAKKVP